MATRGFDAETLTYVDMLQAGIVDPTTVERIALQNPASVASLLLTTEALITDLPAEKGAAAPPMPALERRRNRTGARVGAIHRRG